MSKKILPLQCQIESIETDVAMVVAAMIYPDPEGEKEKRDTLALAIAASDIKWQLLEKSSTELMLWPNELLVMDAKGNSFVFEHKEEIATRIHQGGLVARNMHDLHTWNVYLKRKIAESPNTSIDKKFKPSLNGLWRIAEEEYKDYEKANPNTNLKPYSDKTQQQAWKRMQSVAHFWAAGELLNAIEGRLTECDKTTKEHIRHRRFRTFLWLAKNQYQNCSGIMPHKGKSNLKSEYIYDKANAIWIPSDIDIWLGDISDFLPCTDGMYEAYEKRIMRIRPKKDRNQ